MATWHWIAGAAVIGTAGYLYFKKKDPATGTTASEDQQGLNAAMAYNAALGACLREATDPATGKYDSPQVAACLKAKGMG